MKAIVALAAVAASASSTIAWAAPVDSRGTAPEVSPPVPSVPALDLDRAIELLEARGPTIRISEAELAAAEARRERAEAERMPSLRILSGLTGYRRPQRLYPAAVPGEPALVSHQIASGDVVFAVPLYAGGRLDADEEIAGLAEEGSRARLERTRDQSIFHVTASYYRILARQRFLVALQGAEDGLAAHLRRIEALMQEGKAAPIDARKIEVRLAAVRQQRVEAENLVAVETLGLAAFLGIDAERDAIRIDGELSEPSGGEAAEGLLERARAARGDLREATLAVREADTAVDSSRAALLPQVHLLGSYGLRWGLLPEEQPPGVEAVADVGQIGVGLEIPLFLGGRISAASREHEARLARARERLRQVELQVHLDVEAAQRTFREALRRVALSAGTVEAASEAYRLELERNAAGKSTASDVLVSQAELLDAEAARAQALADANIADAALALAVGEGR